VESHDECPEITSYATVRRGAKVLQGAEDAPEIDIISLRIPSGLPADVLVRAAIPRFKIA